MPQAVRNEIFLELALSIGTGGLDLQALLGTSVPLLLRRLDCALANVSMTQDGSLRSVLTAPRACARDPLFVQAVASTITDMDAAGDASWVRRRHDDIWFYGFPLPGFGAMVLGRSREFDPVFLRELEPIIQMLAQACTSCCEAERRHKAETQLSDAHRQLLTILDGMEAHVYVADMTTYRVLFANNRVRVDFRDDLVGRKCYEVFRHADSPCPYCTNSRLLGPDGRAGGVVVWESESEDKNHSYLNVDRAVEWVDGRLVRLQVATDITERRQMEEERLEMERRLLHAQKLESLGVLAGGLAHDFNNLLMAMSGNLELVVQDLPENTGAQACLQDVQLAVVRARDLTRQMLAYSGRGSFTVEWINISSLTVEMAQLVKSSVPKNVSLELRLDTSLTPIHADAAQIQQVILNLITNAAEAIGADPGTVTISTGQSWYDTAALAQSRVVEKPEPGRFATFSVRDTGSGMDPVTEQQLFDPFFSTKFPGRGLGLSAVLGIVRGHKGAILVNTESGRGSEITVLFPLSSAPDLDVTPVEPRAPSVPIDVEHAGGNVLVVDDEPSVRNSVARMLGRLGYSTASAADGLEALEALARPGWPVSVVLLDLTMPRMDGRKTLAEIRCRYPGLPVVLCSGYDECDVVQHIADDPLTRFLQKPFRLDALQKVLAALLGQAEDHQKCP